MCVEWTGINLNIRFVLESQDKLKMIEFGVNLMLVALIYAVIDPSQKAGAPAPASQRSSARK